MSLPASPGTDGEQLNHDKTSSLPYPDGEELFSSMTLFPPQACPKQLPFQPQHTPQLFYTPALSQPQYTPQLRSTLKPSHLPYPPHPSHARISLRSFEVQFANWTSTHISVIEVGTLDTTLYTADLNIQKPHLIFRRGSTESTVATANLSYFTPDIEVCVNGHSTTLRVEKSQEMQTFYESPALNQACLSWRNRNISSTFDFECLDENSDLLARFSAHSAWNKTRVGQLELFGARVADGAAMDEVVVTGLALAQYALT